MHLRRTLREFVTTTIQSGITKDSAMNSSKARPRNDRPVPFVVASESEVFSATTTGQLARPNNDPGWDRTGLC